MNASFFIPAKTGFWDCDAKNDWMNCFPQDSLPKSDAFYLLHAQWKNNAWCCWKSLRAWQSLSSVALSSSEEFRAFVLCRVQQEKSASGPLTCSARELKAGKSQGPTYEILDGSGAGTALSPHIKPRKYKSVSPNLTTFFFFWFSSGYL